jgi:hypothetical protein
VLFLYCCTNINFVNNTGTGSVQHVGWHFHVAFLCCCGPTKGEVCLACRWIQQHTVGSSCLAVLVPLHMSRTKGEFRGELVSANSQLIVLGCARHMHWERCMLACT